MNGGKGGGKGGGGGRKGKQKQPQRQQKHGASGRDEDAAVAAMIAREEAEEADALAAVAAAIAAEEAGAAGVPRSSQPPRARGDQGQKADHLLRFAFAPVAAETAAAASSGAGHHYLHHQGGGHGKRAAERAPTRAEARARAAALQARLHLVVDPAVTLPLARMSGGSGAGASTGAGASPGSGGGGTAPWLDDPDVAVPWGAVAAVALAFESAAEAACPVSLEPLGATAFALPCGHAFEPFSILRVAEAAQGRAAPVAVPPQPPPQAHYGSGGGGGSVGDGGGGGARCPFCAEAFGVADLRPAAVRVVGALPSPGTIAAFRLLRKRTAAAAAHAPGAASAAPRGGAATPARGRANGDWGRARLDASPPVLVPAGEYDNGAVGGATYGTADAIADSTAGGPVWPAFGDSSAPFSRLSVATPSGLAPLLAQLSSRLGDAAEGFASSGEAAYLPACLAAQDRVAAWAAQWPPPPPSTSARVGEGGGGGGGGGRELFLYQLSDGRRAFLHPLNVKCLLADRGLLGDERRDERHVADSDESPAPGDACGADGAGDVDAAGDVGSDEAVGGGGGGGGGCDGGDGAPVVLNPVASGALAGLGAAKALCGSPRGAPWGLPAVVRGAVVEVEAGVRVTEELRRRCAFLRHLPLGADVAFVEIEVCEHTNTLRTHIYTSAERPRLFALCPNRVSMHLYAAKLFVASVSL